MKRRVEVTPQARRDVAAILDWYRQNVGARAALKVAQTIRSRLVSLEDGRALGTELASSGYRRLVAKKHIIVLLIEAGTIKVVRVVHGAQDLEAIVSKLSDDQP